jgi:hypothetical protein
MYAYMFPAGNGTKTGIEPILDGEKYKKGSRTAI